MAGLCGDGDLDGWRNIKEKDGRLEFAEKFVRKNVSVSPLREMDQGGFNFNIDGMQARRGLRRGFEAFEA